jgi:hypothetical protein
VVNYVNREFNSKLMVGFRSDRLNDKKGQRTGIAGKYTENTLYATKYIGTTIMLRPELRFDHSWDARGHANGTARSQFFFGADLIYKVLTSLAACWLRALLARVEGRAVALRRAWVGGYLQSASGERAVPQRLRPVVSSATVAGHVAAVGSASSLVVPQRLRAVDGLLPRA